MAKEKRDGSKRKRNTPTTALARPAQRKPKLLLPPIPRGVPTFQQPTATELAARLDESTDFVNVKVRAAALLHEEIADHVFRHWYANSVRLAFDESLPPPPGVGSLFARAGKSMHLSNYELRRFVRVAAMNHHLRDPRWRNLPWTSKLELVRLVLSPDRLAAFATGVLFANKANVGLDHVRQHVNLRVAQAPDAPGRPRGLTVPGGEKFATTGLRLSNQEERARFVERLANIEEGRREQLLGDLEQTVENLRRVLVETRRQVAKQDGE